MRSRVPFPHQRQGAEYLMENRGGFLYMEQRTGKTLTALKAVLQHHKALGVRNVLIVTKATVMETWAYELSLEGIPREEISILRGARTKRIKLMGGDFSFVICNYEMLVPYRVLDQRTWSVIIFDESSAVANGEAKVTRYALRAMNRQRKKGNPFVACLSGNPSPESPLQYASQFLLVRGVYFGFTSLPDYQYAHWKDDPERPGKLVPRTPFHLGKLRKMIKASCFIRTMEGLNLGSKILFGRRYVELNTSQKQAIRWAIARKVVLNRGGKEIGDKVYVGYINMIAAGIDPLTGKMINLAKVLDLLDYWQENQEPVLALSFFKAPLRAGMSQASLRGIKADIITGETPVEEREAIRERFQAGDIDILFGQSDALKMGIDLSRASLTFFLSNSFSNDTRDQAVMRTTNVNKEEAVQIVDICTQDTLDDVIVNKLNQKELISDAFLVQEFRQLAKEHYGHK